MLNPKSQNSKPKSFGHRIFKNWLLFGIWCLVLGICTNANALNLDELKIHFLAGEYKQAIKEGERILAESDYSSGLDELYYYLGLCYLQDGNYLRAWDIFEIITNEFKNSKFGEEAILGLGDTYFLRGNFAQAKSVYEKLLLDYPNSKFKPEAQKRLKQVESKGYYTIQVGAFSDISNARKLIRKLTESEYPAYMEEAEIEGIKTYRVRVGKSVTYEGILSLKNRLSKASYPTKIYP